MSLAPEKFWQLLKQSGLLSQEKLESVRSKIGQKESIASSSTKIARLLIANKLLTEKQARRLLSGKPIGTNKEGVSEFVAAPASRPVVNDESSAAKSGTEARSESAATRSKKKSLLPMVLAVTVPLCLLTAGLVWFLGQPKGNDTPTPTTAPSSSETETASQRESSDEPYEIVESDEALWAREQPGQPIQLKFAPAGVQAILRLRLAELDSHPEGEKIIRSVGPGFDSLLSDWLQRVGAERGAVKAITLHLLPQGTTLPQYVVVAELGGSLDTIPSFAKKDSKGISPLATDAIWFPEDDGAHLVFGPSKIVGEIQASNQSGEKTILRRELEQLRLATHDTDHIALLANPNFLRDEAQGLFPNTRRRLLDGLYEFWSQDAQAVSLGVQLTDVALAEARMIAREDLPPRRFAGLVKRRLDELPSRTRDFLGRVELDNHWQRLALRFPKMVDFLTQHSRVVSEDKEVAISAAVPAEAVHNLLLASELSFASRLRVDNANETEDRSSWTIDDVLASSLTIRFAQKSLDIAMGDTAQQVNDELTGLPFQFSIEVVGTDLEPEGITRNQQIRDFESSNKTLNEALTALVMKANPDQSVTVPTDPKQKLIWIPAKGDPGKILISTRVGAKNKGINLPAVFVE